MLFNLSLLYPIRNFPLIFRVLGSELSSRLYFGKGRVGKKDKKKNKNYLKNWNDF